ncbi:protein neuralized-like isoform X1 [Biomphalaria glabrata]|nr:protein neuralized-like isoform X1 [Biomphalaria glabrata]
MGIFDDMENFIIDHFSVTKRHNVQQTIEITNSVGQQLSRSEQNSSELLSRSGSVPLGQRSQQVVSVTQGQLTNEQTSCRSQHVSSLASSSEQISSRLEHGSQRSDGSIGSDIPDLQRSPQTLRSSVPSSPFRERVSWGERATTPVGFPEHFSPQLEHVGMSSPYRSRQRASWVEQSNLSGNSTEQKRAFSFDHVSSSPGLRRAQRTLSSSEHQRTPQSEYGPANSPFRTERTTPQSENLPPNSPFRSERQRVASQSEPTSSASLYRCDCASTQIDNAKNAAISGDYHPGVSSPKLSQNVKHSIDISVSSFSKPKLVRLRSEPCSSSLSMDFFPVRGHSQDDRVKRRREELKRSQSFEASSPTCQEALWTGINVPSQLVITRPQLSRARLNRKHLSLHLEGFPGDSNSSRGDLPLQFHDTHGENVELLNNKTRARRYESFCKGICFSNRPIAVGEKESFNVRGAYEATADMRNRGVDRHILGLKPGLSWVQLYTCKQSTNDDVDYFVQLQECIRPVQFASRGRTYI